MGELARPHSRVLSFVQCRFQVFWLKRGRAWVVMGLVGEYQMVVVDIDLYGMARLLLIRRYLYLAIEIHSRQHALIFLQFTHGFHLPDGFRL